NAVLTQIWIAMCYFLLLAYIKYQTKYKYSLFYLHRLIKETILERLNLVDLLNLNDKLLPKIKNTEQQLALALY
ncbi:MAG TPA: IS4 family transposase, partial [Elusimicrobia bacterium]|nr:IS4 family transposase [Elusimicrobiota bacterium]